MIRNNVGIRPHHHRFRAPGNHPENVRQQPFTSRQDIKGIFSPQVTDPDPFGDALLEFPEGFKPGQLGIEILLQLVQPFP